MAVLPLSEAFTARALGVAWNNYQQSLGLPPYLGRAYFGTDKKMGLDLSFIKGRKGVPVALKGSSFDAQAPLRDGIGFAQIQNTMPFFRESYMVTEKEEQEYMTFLNSANDVGANQVLREIMKSPLDLINGANVIPERMIWQLMAPVDGVPKITVLIDGKDPYDIHYTSDNGAAYKSTNFMEITTATDMWDAPTTANPIQDILDAQRRHRSVTGEVLADFIMNDKTFQMFCNAEATRKQVLGLTAYNEGILASDADIRSYMRNKYGINILVYNKMYSDVTGTTNAFIPDGIITAVASNARQLGTVMYGTTPEERSGSLTDGSLAIVDTGVAVYTYVTNHPINTHCVVSEIVLPTYENMDSVFVMKVAA